MEGAVPDITAKQIIEDEIVPNFKQQNYYRGFDLAADAIIKASRGEYVAPSGYNQRKKHGTGRRKYSGGHYFLHHYPRADQVVVVEAAVGVVCLTGLVFCHSSLEICSAAWAVAAVVGPVEEVVAAGPAAEVAASAASEAAAAAVVVPAEVGKLKNKPGTIVPGLFF